MSRPPLALAAFCFLVFSGSARAAGTPGETAAAQALFDEARSLIEEGHYAEACPKLEESQRLDPAWGTLINLADCYERTGRTASAWSRFLQVAAGSRQAGQIARAETAKARAAALEDRLSKMVISVASSDRPAGIEVKRDGVDVGAAQFDTSVPVDPGEHTIEASAPGRKSWKMNVVVGPIAETLRINVPNLEREEAPGATTIAPERKPTWSSTQVAGVALAGAGLVSLGLGGFYVARAIHFKQLSDENHDCIGNDCNAEGTIHRNDALEAGRTASIWGIAGGIGVAGGAALFILGRPAAARSTLHVRADLGRCATLSLEGTF
jgi:serine/threonine-protein kinase